MSLRILSICILIFLAGLILPSIIPCAKPPNKYSSADVRDKPGFGGKIPHVPKLLDQVREVLRMKHYSLRTEQAYINWIKRYIFFHDKRHPAEMGETEIRAFVSNLASKRSVAASTQTVALSALLFLYRDVLKKEQPFVEGIERAKKPERLPVVFTKGEVTEILSRLDGVPYLIAGLLYGSGLRLMDALRLRVKDIDFGRGEITVRDGKGEQDPKAFSIFKLSFFICH